MSLEYLTHDFELADPSKRGDQAAKLADHLKNAAVKYSGVVAYEFMAKLVALTAEMPEFVDTLQKLYKTALDGLV
jgi:hypothetical protein